MRPQAFKEMGAGGVGSMGGAGSDSWRMPVRVVEPLGDSMDVYCRTTKHSHIVARVSASGAIKAGEVANFVLHSDEVHYFEVGEFGRNLNATTT